MDAKALIAAVSEVADNKGLSGEAVIQALELALEKAYIKVLGGSTPDLPDPVVKCVIDPDTGKIYLAQVKKVVEEVTDDFLEIDEEEANEGLKKAKYHVGDDYEIEADVEDLSKATAMGVKSYFRQGIAEAERTELYKIYKDHIGEMVTGTVEKADDRSVIVNIGRATVELNRKELIGDEYFKIGDPIKVYIQEVRSADEATSPYKKKGPQIEATRSSACSKKKSTKSMMAPLSSKRLPVRRASVPKSRFLASMTMSTPPELASDKVVPAFKRSFLNLATAIPKKRSISSNGANSPRNSSSNRFARLSPLG